MTEGSKIRKLVHFVTIRLLQIVVWIFFSWNKNQWNIEFFYCPRSATLQNSIGILLQLHINILENSTWNKLLILIPVQYIHIHIFTQTKNFFQPHHEGLFSCKTLHMVFRNRLNVQHVEYSHIFAIWQTEL